MKLITRSKMTIQRPLSIYCTKHARLSKIPYRSTLAQRSRSDPFVFSRDIQQGEYVVIDGDDYDYIRLNLDYMDMHQQVPLRNRIFTVSRVSRR